MNTISAKNRLVGFLHYLRAQGYVVGIDETLDTLATLDTGSMPSRALAHGCVRALVCRDQEEWSRFERYFAEYWYPATIEPEEEDVVAMIDPRVRRRRQGVVGLASGTSEPYGDSDRPGIIGTGAGRQKTLTRADYRFLKDRQAMRAAERLAETLARVLNSQLSRRKVVLPRGRRLEVRRTVRRSLAFGGMPVNRLYKEAQRNPPNLVLLHDISHSMSWHNPLLYRFVRGIARTVAGSEAFAFHTRLFRVTDIYREPSLERMRQRLEADNKLWLGGTCIAESIRTFTDQWAGATLNTRSVVILLSDGFDTDTPQELAKELEKLRERCRSIVWLNPMLGREGYRLDPSFSTLLEPFVDRFLPAHSIDALRDAIIAIRNASKA